MIDAFTHSATLQSIRPPVGREEVGSEICTSLRNGPVGGAVIAGPAGIGKTAVTRYLASRLSDTCQVIMVRGSAFGSKLNFGALGFLLTELDELSFGHPMRIVQELTGVLQSKARGRETIFVVDNADRLDEFSAMVLAQLVLNGTSKVILACPDFSKAPEDFTGLWRAGLLDRFDLKPLSRSESTQLIAAELGQQISPVAAFTLYRHSGGNPQNLMLLCRDYVTSGALAVREDIWVITGRPYTLTPSSVDVIKARLPKLTVEQRKVIELLAVTGNASLPAVSALMDSTELDMLQESGVITVHHEDGLTVSLKDSLVVEAVYVGLTEGRRNELRRMAPTEAPGESQLPDQQLHTGQSKVLLKARKAAFEGNYLESAVLFGTLNVDAVEETGSGKILAAAGSCEALALTGRPLDALAVARSLEEKCETADHRELTEVAARLACVHVAFNGWTETRPRLSGRVPVNAVGACMEELVEGLLLAFAGRAADALPLLLPVLRQLQQRDTLHAGSLAAAAAAYCRALGGEFDQARALLIISGKNSREPSWLVQRLTDHFAAMTLSITADPADAIRRLVQLGDADRVLGNSTCELLALSSALRLGDYSVIERLLVVSAASQGPFAQLCEQYAKGSDTSDIHMVLQAMESAQALGDVLFARDVAQSARRLAAGAGNRVVMRHVQRRTRPVLAGDAHPKLNDSRLASLTIREIEVVQHIANGANNRLIAEDLGVSVRTVEGHLYQVYSKLHVNNRSDLAQMVAASMRDSG